MKPTITPVNRATEASRGGTRDDRVLCTIRLGCLMGIALAASSCSVVRTGSSETKAVIQSFTGTGGKAEARQRQREAAISQLLAGVASERSNLVASMASGEKRLRDLLPQMRQTFDAAGQMGTSLNAAMKSLDAFVHYVSPPDTNTTPQPPDTNSPPFNVLDYGTAASK
jgi:hypothetical protein